jgi:Brp/Blh family beta-carotene 15,15'-monooxygenase
MSIDTRRAAAPETAAFLAVASALAALTLFGPTPSDGDLALLLAAAVAFAGLPHGALDPWVARRAALWRTAHGAAAFHVAYVLAATAVLIAWQVAPAGCLAAFLALSAWHFGGDWAASPVVRTVLGTALFALPAWRWLSDVAAIFGALAGDGGAAIAGALAALGPWLGVAVLALAVASIRRAPGHAAEWLALGALALVVPPLAYFAAYFCALHSVRHLRLLAAQAAPSVRPRLAAIAAIYTALALMGAALAWAWLADGAGAGWSDDLLRVVFIGLAALTVPHMVVVGLAERHRGADAWA